MYFIMQFQRPKKHRAGQVSRDITQIGDYYSNQHKAEMALYDLMANYRFKEKAYLRIDEGARHNPVVFADLERKGGSIVRFLRDTRERHWTKAITLIRFKRRLDRVEESLERRKRKKATQKGGEQ